MSACVSRLAAVVAGKLAASLRCCLRPALPSQRPVHGGHSDPIASQQRANRSAGPCPAGSRPLAAPATAAPCQQQRRGRRQLQVAAAKKGGGGGGGGKKGGGKKGGGLLDTAKSVKPYLQASSARWQPAPWAGAQPLLSRRGRVGAQLPCCPV
jgi:hypothetical protein